MKARGFRTASPMVGRRGTTLVETAIATILSGLVIVGSMHLFAWARRSEQAVCSTASLTDQAALAQAWLSRDLDRLLADDEKWPLQVRPVSSARGAFSGGELCFHIHGDAASDAPQEVTYRFDPDEGELWRRSPGQPVRRFKLGGESVVVFVKVDPSFADGQQAELGRYNNRLVYRITAKGLKTTGSRMITLVGALPFHVKASRDTFPFWNR